MHISSSEKYITSPNYPEHYPSNYEEVKMIYKNGWIDSVQCNIMMTHLQTWTIQSTNGIVLLEFGSFDVQSTPDCWQDDYVEISYGSFSQKYCNQFIDIPGPIPGPFTSFGSPITVKFHTGSTGTNTGFLAAACCSVTITNNIDTGKPRPLS